jgi:hypothetical protein
MNIGILVYSIRNNEHYSDHKDELIKIQFNFNHQRSIYGWACVKKALVTYKKMYGDLLVPSKFIIERGNSSWSQSVWGINLGTVVNSIRNIDSYSDHKDALIEMGFVYDPQRSSYGWSVVRKALLTYKELHGDLVIPYKFSVDNGNEAWPKDLWGMNIGSIANNIRNLGTFSNYKTELTEMGFVYDLKRFKWERIKRALLHCNGRSRTGELGLDIQFVIPESAEWPEDLWGMRLGSVAYNIRYNNAYPEYNHELLEQHGVKLVKKKSSK